MASITLRNLDDDTKRRPHVRAAERGRSMEREARDILRQDVGQPDALRNLSQSIHARFAALDGVDLPPVKRTPMRPAPDLEGCVILLDTNVVSELMRAEPRHVVRQHVRRGAGMAVGMQREQKVAAQTPAAVGRSDLEQVLKRPHDGRGRRRIVIGVGVGVCRDEIA